MSDSKEKVVFLNPWNPLGCADLVRMASEGYLLKKYKKTWAVSLNRHCYWFEYVGPGNAKFVNCRETLGSSDLKELAEEGWIEELHYTTWFVELERHCYWFRKVV